MIAYEIAHESAKKHSTGYTDLGALRRFLIDILPMNKFRGFD